MRTNNRPCFPQRLFLLLKLVEDKGLDHIVSWVNDGSAFKVHDLKKFQDELLPKYFSTKKYASFTRQLCAYGFACLRTGRQTGICKFFHQGFTSCLYATCLTLSPLSSSLIRLAPWFPSQWSCFFVPNQAWICQERLQDCHFQSQLETFVNEGSSSFDCPTSNSTSRSHDVWVPSCLWQQWPLFQQRSQPAQPASAASLRSNDDDDESRSIHDTTVSSKIAYSIG